MSNIIDYGEYNHTYTIIELLKHYILEIFA